MHAETGCVNSALELEFIIPPMLSLHGFFGGGTLVWASSKKKPPEGAHGHLIVSVCVSFKRFFRKKNFNTELYLSKVLLHNLSLHLRPKFKFVRLIWWTHPWLRQQSISSTIYAHLLRRYFAIKKFQSKNITREKLRKALSYKKIVCKMVVILIPGLREKDRTNLAYLNPWRWRSV